VNELSCVVAVIQEKKEKTTAVVDTHRRKMESAHLHWEHLGCFPTSGKTLSL